MHKISLQLGKIQFYLSGYARSLIPSSVHRSRLADRLRVPLREHDALRQRVDYYLKHSAPFMLPTSAPAIGSLRRGYSNAYYFDLRDLVRYFPRDLRLSYLFGDITHVPDHPTLVKSRPIGAHNAHSVLLKLNRIRHFTFVKRDMPFDQKRDVVVWRGKCYGKPHRLACVERHHATPGCDVGDINPKLKGTATWKPFMSIAEQLRCKFILSIEGRDVATNLKWIMSSNSLCFMNRPRFETWFMEGRLQPGVHYVEVREDFADLLEKRDHYLAHPQEAAAIIANAQRHVAQFRDRRREELLGLLVLRKYFALSGQWDLPDPLAT